MSNRQNIDRQNTDFFFGDMQNAKIPICITKDMQIPPALSFAPVLMQDAEGAELTEKSIFHFLFFELLEIHRKLGCFKYKNDHNLKNKNRKIVFSFVSAHSASCI